MYAIEEIKPALRHTWKKLFDPFRAKKLFLLCLVVMFMGGGMWTPLPRINSHLFKIIAQYEAMKLFDPGQILDFLRQCLTRYFMVSAVLFSIFLLMWFVYIFFSSVFKFVFLEALLEEEFSLKQAYAKQFKNGVSFFIFILFLDLVVLGAMMHFVVVPFVENLKADVGIFDFSGLALGLFRFSFVAMIIGFLKAIAEDFIIPLMQQKQQGVIRACEDFIGILSGNLKELAVYEVARFFLKVAGFIVSGFIFLWLFLAWVIIEGLAFIFLFGLSEVLTLGWTGKAIIIAGVFVPLSAVLLLGFACLAYLPVAVFFRYYSLAMLSKCQYGSIDLPEILY